MSEGGPAYVSADSVSSKLLGQERDTGETTHPDIGVALLHAGTTLHPRPSSPAPPPPPEFATLVLSHALCSFRRGLASLPPPLLPTPG